jgi:transcriptional regulator with XRE-family HTH domain
MHQLPALSRMLRKARMQARLTRQGLAKAADIEPLALYGRMEDATMMPSRATLRRLCTVLQLDFDAVVKAVRGEEELPHHEP